MSSTLYGTDPLEVYGLHARQTIETHRSRLLIRIGLEEDPIRTHGKEPHPVVDRDIDVHRDAVLPVAIIGAGNKLPHL